MKLPQTGRQKTLFVIDLQPAFLKSHNMHIVKNIEWLLNNVEYNSYVEAVFSAEKDSLWDQQQEWFSPFDDDTRTIESVKSILESKNPLHVHKSSRSIFSGNQNVVEHLQEIGTEEIHIVGTETHDCVLASAFAAFDSGFPVYVLEECCESATPERHAYGLQLLRWQSMTNNSCIAPTVDAKVS